MIVHDERLLAEFRAAGPCEICQAHCNRRQPHHALCRGFGGGNRLDVRLNLLSLGDAFTCHCHGVAQENKLKLASVLTLIGLREGNLTTKEVEHQLRRMQRAPSDCALCPQCKGNMGRRDEISHLFAWHACPFCDGAGILRNGQPYTEVGRGNGAASSRNGESGNAQGSEVSSHQRDVLPAHEVRTDLDAGEVRF